jgi:hypothetical protein
MQFHHATEEVPFGDPLNVRSAWEVRARTAICPCYSRLFNIFHPDRCAEDYREKAPQGLVFGFQFDVVY